MWEAPEPAAFLAPPFHALTTPSEPCTVGESSLRAFSVARLGWLTTRAVYAVRVVVEVFAGASSEVVPLREIEVGGQGAGEEQRRLQERRQVGHRIDVYVVTPMLELVEEPAGLRRTPRDREPVDAPAAQHVNQLLGTPRDAEHERREEVDGALPDRGRVVRRQLPEPELAERLDCGVEPQSVLRQPALDEL